VPDDAEKDDPTRSDLPPPEAGGETGEPVQEDRFAPDAIAARIDRIGNESDADRIAREEEQKLLERKKQQKTVKRGLEASASKRLSRIGDVKVKRPSAASDAYIPEADPLLDRARDARKWIEKNQGLFGGLVAIVVIGLAGALGWTYWQGKRNADASALLGQAFADEHGHVSDKEDDDDQEGTRPAQLYPTFKSIADRRSAAIGKYREVESRYPGTGAAILARLAEAGILLDQGDAKAAIEGFDDVKASPLAAADGEVRGRALEGEGFAHELLAESDATGKSKHLDDALAAFKALEQTDFGELKELGMYHQARVFQAKGDKARAIELLKDVYKRTSEAGESHKFSYLEFVVEDRLRDLDPSALPPKAPKKVPGGDFGNNLDMSNPKMQELLRHLQEQGQGRGMPPVPAPSGSP
jgi:hypothetical protein